MPVRHRRARPARGPSFSRAVPLTLALVSLGCAAGKPAPDEGSARGLVVQEVPAGAIGRAGLRVGDRLVAWRRREGGGAAEGTLVSPLELWLVEHEQASRGPVELQVVRGGGADWMSVPPGRWYVEARPALGGDALDAYRRGKEALDAGAVKEGEALLREAAQLVPGERVADRIFVLVELARRLPEPRADGVFADALRLAGSVSRKPWAALLHAERGRALDRAGRFEEALDAYDQAVSLWRREGLDVAAAITLAEIGRIEGRRGDPAAEERLHRQALSILDRAAPESLEVSRILRGLARARATQDDVSEAFAHARRALDIAARLAPGGFDHEAALMIEGIFHWIEEDWEPAEARLLEALEIVERLDPEHEDVSNTLHNLGLVALYRGDQAQASDYFVRALDAEPHGDPIQRTKMLNSLGSLALARYDLVAAKRWYREVLEIRERLTPDSLNVATPLLNLGEVARLSGSLDEAEELLSRALALQRRFIPDSRDPAMTLLNLAIVSETKGDLALAEGRAREALGIVREKFPGVLLEASLRHTLGTVLLDRGRGEAARPELQRAVEIFARLAPDTTEAALALYDLGRLQRDAGRPEAAAATLLRAVGILERQGQRLGGSDDVRSRFRGHLQYVYREGIELLMDLGRAEAAFHLLERSQARSLLALLAERGLDPERRRTRPEDRARRSELAAEYDRITSELSELSLDSDASSVAELAHRLDAVRLGLEELRSRAGDAERRVLADDERQILDLDEALDALPEDTVAIEFCVGEARSWVFVLGPGRGFRTVEIPAGASELEDRVERLRLLIERPVPEEDGYRDLAAELYRELVAPAEPEIESSRRMVIVPDGPLHLLPFAVLYRADGPGRGRHLIEWRPLQIAASLTVFHALGQRPAVTEGRVVAFVDPSPEGGTPGALAPPPLPEARREAEGLRRLFGERAVAYVGPEATEGRAKALGGDERIVHFATHGRLDPRSPLDSGLLLRPSRRESGFTDNGLLQAWEIFDSLHTSAELVTLSSCESAAGLRVAGEGLLSLTRAFQYAGARSVLASLWRVSDRSTALLMDRFYGRLAAGAPADEALQTAQVAMLRGETRPLEASGLRAFFDRLFQRGAPRALQYRHPYYWAAFQLYGPGRGSPKGPGSSSRRESLPTRP